MSRIVLSLTAPALLIAGCAAAQPSVSTMAPARAQAGAAVRKQAAPVPVPAAEALLAAHNRYRREAGVPPLLWDSRLVGSAADHARDLSARGEMVHSPRASRPGIGENLWIGSAGAYSPAAMVDYWGEERRQYRDGIFPQVSSTGDWLDVSHYTQMIWRGTTHVGCGLHRGARWDVLVCRYAPKGNRDGQTVR